MFWCLSHTWVLRFICSQGKEGKEGKEGKGKEGKEEKEKEEKGKEEKEKEGGEPRRKGCEAEQGWWSWLWVRTTLTPVLQDVAKVSGFAAGHEHTRSGDPTLVATCVLLQPLCATRS